MDPLYICDQYTDHCYECQECPCKYPHTEDECVGKDIGCDCIKIDEFAQQENECEWDECHPVLIMDKMPQLWGDSTLSTSGSISPRLSAGVMRDMLERAMPHMLLKKFYQNSKNIFPGSGNTGETITFRRYTSLHFHRRTYHNAK